MPRYKILEDQKPYLYEPVLGGTNDIPDSSFSSGITGWSAVSSATLAHETNSLKVTAANAASGASYTTGSVAVGEKRILKVKVKGTGASIGKFIRAKITANGDASSQDTRAVKLTSSFQEVWCTYYIPATGTITVSVYGVDLASTEIFYIDDVVFDTYQTPVVTTSGRLIFYNGVRTWWRGCNYNNTPTEGASGTNVGTEEKMLGPDTEDLVDHGDNCARVYMSNWNQNDYGRFLDTCYQKKIGVQAWYFIWIQSLDYRASTGPGQTNRAAKVTDYALWVNRLKNHPAIVAYLFGSEGNFHVADPGSPGENNTQDDWYTLVNECSVAAKAADPTRLTSTSNGGVNSSSADALTPNMDFWSYTIYRGSAAQIHRWSSIDALATDIPAKTTRPAVLSEIAGTGCYNAAAPNSRDYLGQALSNLAHLRRAESLSDIIQGTFYFQFSDDSSDTSMYGYTDSVAGGTSTSRPKRITWDMTKQYYNTTTIPI